MPTDYELMQAAEAACENAYAPYSGFKVGAALLTGDGRIYCTLDLAVDPDFVEAFTTTKMYPILSGTPGFSNCPWPQSATEEEWKNTNKYIVDYVHLYQLDDGVSELTTE